MLTRLFGEQSQGQRHKDVEEGGAENFFFGGDGKQRPLAGRQVSEAVFGGEAAQTGKKVGGKLLIGGQQFKFIEQHDNGRILLVNLVQRPVQRPVSAGGLVRLDRDARILRRIQQAIQQRLVNLFRRRAPKFLAINQDKQRMGRIELHLRPHLVATQVNKQ